MESLRTSGCSRHLLCTTSVPLSLACVFTQYCGDQICMDFHWPHTMCRLISAVRASCLLPWYFSIDTEPQDVTWPLQYPSHIQPIGRTFDHWETDADGQIFSPLPSSQMHYSETSSYGFLANSPRRLSSQFQKKKWLILLLVFLSSLPHSPSPYSFLLLRTAHPNK